MNLDVGTIAIIFGAMAIGSFVKGVTGMGLPQIAIPVMAIFLGVEAAVVVMAIPGIITNTWLLWNYRGHFRVTRDLPALLVAGSFGAVAGTVLLDTLDEDVLSFVLAGMIGVYAVMFLTNPSLRLSPDLTRYTSPPVGLAAGVLQGATGMSGTVISTYLHSYRLTKEAYVLSITTIFQVFAVVQALTLAGVGLYTGNLFVLSMLSLVPIMALLPLGARFTDRLSRRTFDFVILLLLLVSALKLVYDGMN
ncbi:MAG: sulfite exporter TauE/SafE family protein [Actinomycetota bacterium]